MRARFMFSAAFLSVVFVSRARGDAYFPNFLQPGFFGLPDTTYQEWNGFTTGTGANAPTQINNPAGGASAYDATAATDDVFLTGTHIYSFTGVIHPTLTISNFGHGPDWETILWLQIETYGKEIDPGSVRATPVGGSPIAPDQTTLLFQSLSEGSFGTFALDDWLFVWKLPGNASGYTFSMAGLEPSVSWYGARVDTQAIAVPEPGALGLAFGIACLSLRRRRP